MQTSGEWIQEHTTHWKFPVHIKVGVVSAPHYSSVQEMESKVHSPSSFKFSAIQQCSSGSYR